ncbi:BadM/Rrf2 family transcriptional regulator [Sediminihabitans luteus]|uniref:BadM/Rrf2 family transcriptional regulator n=1 Tax=Sediminihabitans luteus TaxID=1138585 RepID=A0A2M9CF19_9CELL|nr:Rrf2 family transcriptional regulator [Sediminihabitans luteus]PJJ70479.1 BadM/Rrf2 family transcriptional regulator [Sediminihabitans luteus]GII97952.1 Rrf2 family transcriptional regulator [Sediminihabitans luteus]
MRISARADYAIRASAELAAAAGDHAVTAETLARAQEIPHKFLEGILTALRRDGLVTSQRGAGGGYWLAGPPEDVTLAAIIRAVDGPLVFVRGERPSDLTYDGAASSLLPVWVALRANVRAVLERVTLADLVAGRLPVDLQQLVDDDASWENP